MNDTHVRSDCIDNYVRYRKMANAALLRISVCVLLAVLSAPCAFAAENEGLSKSNDANPVRTRAGNTQSTGLTARPQMTCSANNTSATAFAITANPLDKTQVLDDVYLSVFRSDAKGRWLGNIKKFKIQDGLIVGQGNEASELSTVSVADDASGSLKFAAKDLWQQPGDLKDDFVTRGGAASLLSPLKGSPGRNIYTYVSGVTHPSAPVELSLHPFTWSNKNLNSERESLNLSASDPSRDTVINWVLGNSDGKSAAADDTRSEMGATIHSQPVVVVYGNVGNDLNSKLTDAVVFALTNDGYLHALDATSGRELWAFIPQELLKSLKFAYAGNPSETKRYLLDGNIRILKYDVDGDGAVEPADNDRVFLYFSQGRGGENYFALDVTDKLNPKFLWSLNGATELSGIVEQSWSTPTVGRVLVGDGSKQNLQKLVLFFGGGYDSNENRRANTSSGNAHGNALFMVDAVNGTVLWHQTRTASGPFANMTHPIPSNVTVLDTNEDGWTDRIYVGDLAGQLWRLDITNGNTGNFETGNEVNVLASGGVIASIGGKISARIEDDRRFYFAPDVAKVVVHGGSSYYSVSAGTGELVLPRTNAATEDRFYSLRDYHLEAMTQAQYNGNAPVTDAGENSGLASINTASQANPSARPRGWKLVLQTGEKVLAKSITVDRTVVFTTYLPAQTNNNCSAALGSGRAYTIDIDKGRKHFDSLYEPFAVSGEPSEVTIVNKSALIRADSSRSGHTLAATDRGSICWSGVTLLKRCVAFGDRVKTVWKDSGTN
jgi:type IV pilus assembly protein PilY1